MFKNKKLGTYQKEILLACATDELLKKIKEKNNEDYICACKSIKLCWEWIEKMQVHPYDMYTLVDSENGDDLSYYIEQCDNDSEKQKIYDVVFKSIIYIVSRALSYEQFLLPSYLDYVYSDEKYWDKIIGEMLSLDANLKIKWNKILNFYGKEKENICRNIKWKEKDLKNIKPTFLKEDEEYSTYQKEILLLYVANELVKELKGDDGYKFCYDRIMLCWEWIKYKEVAFETICEAVENKRGHDINYYMKNETDGRKIKIYKILLKILTFESYKIISYENVDMKECLYSIRSNLNYWEETIEEIIELDNNWKKILGKIFTIFLIERDAEYAQKVSLREVLSKL